MFSEDLECYELQEGESQYDKVEMEYLSHYPVKARYIKPLCEYDYGNPFISALPPARTAKECMSAYTTEIPYNPDKIAFMSEVERLENIKLLSIVRLCIPYYFLLERNFRDTLNSAYTDRHHINLRRDKVLYAGEYSVDMEFTPKIDGSVTGFSLLGNSGCGKSSAIGACLEHYPQVIYHETDTSRFLQIIYIKVECPTNANMGSLYADIGIELDRALETDTYEKMILHARNYGEKSNVLCKILTNLNVGCVIVEEIQHLADGNSKEASFDTFMSISNKTRTPFIVIGTLDGYKEVFHSEQVAKRVGVQLPADGYCKDKVIWDYIIKRLWRYQWYGTKMKLTDDINEILYEETNGIIGLLVTLLKYMQVMYILKKMDGQITPAYIRQIMKEYFPRIRELLHKRLTGEETKELQEICKSCDNTTVIIEKYIEELDRKALLSDEETARAMSMTQKTNYVYNSITTVFGSKYSFTEIDKVLKQVLKLKSNKNLSIEKITQNIVKKLQMNDNVNKENLKNGITSEINVEERYNYISNGKDDL